MDWTLAYFRKQARKWNDQRMTILKSSANDIEMVEGDGGPNPEKEIGGPERGLYCYTFKQEDMWLGFAGLAQDLFSKARASYPI
jgi:hypothetical protein